MIGEITLNQIICLADDEPVYAENVPETTYKYAAEEREGSWIITFLDFPQVITRADDISEIESRAMACLEEVLKVYIRNAAAAALAKGPVKDD